MAIVNGYRKAVTTIGDYDIRHRFLQCLRPSDAQYFTLWALGLDIPNVS